MCAAPHFDRRLARMTRFRPDRHCLWAICAAMFRPPQHLIPRLRAQQENDDMDTIEATAINPAKLDAFMGRVISDISAGYGGIMISLGYKLGLYKAMAGAGPLSARELAARASCAERY